MYFFQKRSEIDPEGLFLAVGRAGMTGGARGALLERPGAAGGAQNGANLTPESTKH